MVFGHKAKLFNKDLITTTLNFQYPIEKDTLLMDNLLLGKLNVSKEIFQSMIDYVHNFSCAAKRIHSSIKDMSPIEYERELKYC
jgi:hypothetical protein